MLIYEELSKKVINAYYNVQKVLGKGLAEKVYENALCIELEEMGVTYVRQKELPVDYKGHNIGNYIADITNLRVIPCSSDAKQLSDAIKRYNYETET